MITLSVQIFACNFWKPNQGTIFVSGLVYQTARYKRLINEQNVRKNVRNDLVKSLLWNM